MEKIILQRSVGIHDGSFHADEVTACALLLIYQLIDYDKIVRSRDSEVLSHCEFICDVGGLYDPSSKRFDHHQDSYEGPLSSAGMILLYLYEQQLMDEELYLFLKRALIDGVDLIDIGHYEPPLGLSTFSAVIANFMPPSYGAEPAQIEKSFFHALDFTIDHLKRLLLRYETIRKYKDVVAEEMKKGKNFLLFNEPMPWLEPFFSLGGESHPAQFVVMPSREHWKLRGVPPTLEQRMQVRQPLPKEWAGLFDQELQKITGIKGAIFCHKGRFISVWETKEDALKALKLIVGQEECDL